MKVLIIQQKMIGDVLTSSILFEVIKRKYPESELHYLINAHTYPVVEENPNIDNFIFFSPDLEKSKIKFYSFLKELKREKYDVVIDAYSKVSSNLITLFAKAKTRISKYKWYTSFLYTHPIKYNTKTTSNTGLAIENRLQLLEPLGFDKDVLVKPKIYLRNDELEEAKQFLMDSGINLSKPIYMISVLGSGLSKTYPFDYMAKTLDHITKLKPEAQILFNYIPKQLNEAKAIYNLCGQESQDQIFFDVFGKSLRSFLAITKQCTALIGNEGGAVNMAKAMDIPTFTIFSPWIDKETWSVFEGNTNVSVHLNDYRPELYSRFSAIKKAKVEFEALYKEFKPGFFLEALGDFLT